jgi:AraC family transcriptional regulator
MLQSQIAQKPELHVVGLEASFIHALSPDKTNFQVIGPLWDQFPRRAGEVLHRSGHAMVGVIYGRPEAQRAHPDELQYIAGVPVSTVAEIPKGMVSRSIPAGTFAVFTHRGPISAIGDTMHAIYRVWLPQSGYRHSEIADIEWYDDRFCAEGAESEMDYWVSVTLR